MTNTNFPYPLAFETDEHRKKRIAGLIKTYRETIKKRK